LLLLLGGLCPLQVTVLTRAEVEQQFAGLDTFEGNFSMQDTPSGSRDNGFWYQCYYVSNQ
jgi:hypothetical protein